MFLCQSSTSMSGRPDSKSSCKEWRKETEAMSPFFEVFSYVVNLY